MFTSWPPAAVVATDTMLEGQLLGQGAGWSSLPPIPSAVTFRMGTGWGPRQEGEEGSPCTWKVYVISPRRADTLKCERLDSQFPSWLSAQEADWGREAPAP